MRAVPDEEEVSPQVSCPPSELNIFEQGGEQFSFCCHFYSSCAMIEMPIFLNVSLWLNFLML